MIDFKYLYQGLCGMARAHLASGMAGHLGAAVVTGYFIGEELPQLDTRIYRAIEKDLDRIVRGEEAIWYDAEKTGISVPEMFKPFADPQSPSVDISAIAEALAGNIEKTRSSGHNVIFASIALRALHDHDQFATEEIVSGIASLINKFDGKGPGQGYYGQPRGWVKGEQVELDEQTEFPDYRNQQEMVDVVIDELIRSAALRRQGYGGLFHIINHAAAITELSRFGYDELARRALAAHHHHLRLWRSLPDVEAELGPLKAAQHDPKTIEYWQEDLSSQWSAQLTHRVKTIYGLQTLLRFVESAEKKKKAEEQFLYLMG